MTYEKEEEPKEEITLEDLARMVQSSFTQTASMMQEGFAQVEARFAQVDERLTALDERITGLDRKTESQHQDIMHELKPLKKTVPNIEADLADHELRIKALERRATAQK